MPSYYWMLEVFLNGVWCPSTVYTQRFYHESEAYALIEARGLQREDYRVAKFTFPDGERVD